MAKKKIVILLCFIIGICSTSAQTITLKGAVKDSLQNPLSYANVIAKPIDVSKNLQFAITGNDGLYKLELHKNEKYTISVSFMGFETYNIEFEAIQNSIQNIVLKEAPNQLQEVIIELPVMVKEDTITYNTDKFITGEERKLKQVLNKLPGVEVDKNGTVTVQGKKVTTMLVEGKKFFGGNSKLAVENIPANAVDKVQVIDNYNEIAFLKDLSDSDEMAMNILLKEDKKQFAFGDVEAGKGNKDFYRAHSNLFYYSPKTNVNFIGNLNNTGEKTFTFKDYMSFQGGVSAVLKGDGSFYNISGSDFGQFMETHDVIKSENQFGAVNISNNISNKVTISGYGIFSNTKNETFKETLNTYPVYVEAKEAKNNTNNILGIGKFNVEYAPNLNEQWYFKTQVKKANNNLKSQQLADINSVIDEIVTNKKTTQALLNQIVEWHKKQSSKHTFSFAADVVFDKNNPNIYWETSQPFLTGIIPTEEDERYYFNQLSETKHTNLNAIFKHYWVLNKNNHIYTTVGNNLTSENFYTNDTKLLEDGTEIDLDNFGFNNQVAYTLNDLFLGIHYKFRSGIFTLKQGVFFHQYNWNVGQENTAKTTNSKFIPLPDFLAKIEFSNSESINIKYNLKSSFADVSKLANRFYLLNYNSLYRGNEQLENELFQTASIFYKKFSLYRGLMLFGGLNYSKKFQGINSIVQFEGASQFLTPMMLKNPDENLGFNLNVNKKIKNLKYDLTTSGTTSKYQQSVNETTSTNINNNINYQVSVKSLFDNFPIVEIGFKQSFGYYKSSNQVSKFSTNEPFVTIDYDFLKGFIFAFDYEYYNYKNKTYNQTNTYQLANTSLLYQKEDSAWTFKIEAQNLFNVKYKRTNYFSSYIISDAKIYILPRIVMFSIAYNL